MIPQSLGYAMLSGLPRVWVIFSDCAGTGVCVDWRELGQCRRSRGDTALWPQALQPYNELPPMHLCHYGVVFGADNRGTIVAASVFRLGWITSLLAVAWRQGLLVARRFWFWSGQIKCDGYRDQWQFTARECWNFLFHRRRCTVPTFDGRCYGIHRTYYQPLLS